MSVRTYPRPRRSPPKSRPLGFDAGDANLYRYIHNVPTFASDPWGLFEWKYRGNPVMIQGKTDTPKVIPRTVVSKDGKTVYGKVVITVKVDNAVDITFKYEPGKNCPCKGKAGWIQHVLDDSAGAGVWRYDNSSETYTLQVKRGSPSDPSLRNQPTKRPDKKPWKENPWYGGPGDVKKEAKDEKEMKEWATNPSPQKEIQDKPGAGVPLAFVTQLVCEGTGEVIFEYAWLQNVKSGDKTYKFVGDTPFYGKDFGEKGRGLIITPGE